MMVAAFAAAATDPRLAGRLDPETAAAVARVVDEARTAGLPTEPLVAKALEGATKHAKGDRIVAAVRHYATALGGSRAALGEGSSESEIVAGASALLAGIPGDTLVQLRAARPRQSLTIPLVVLADLVARKVPAGTASAAVLGASRAGIRDADFLRLRERIEHDIRAGASPDAATLGRARALAGERSTSPPLRATP